MLHVQIDAMLWNRALVSSVTHLNLAGLAEIISGGLVIGIGVWCVGVTNTTYGRVKVPVLYTTPYTRPDVCCSLYRRVHDHGGRRGWTRI